MHDDRPHAAHVDSCPSCSYANNRPLTTTRTAPDAVRCQYRCPRCLWSWWTAFASHVAKD